MGPGVPTSHGSGLDRPTWMPLPALASPGSQAQHGTLTTRDLLGSWQDEGLLAPLQR